MTVGGGGGESSSTLVDSRGSFSIRRAAVLLGGRVEFSRCLGMLGAARGCSGLLRLGTALHSHSPGLLINRSGYSHVYTGLEFGEVKIGVRV
jgi:hypothetical protein